MEKTKTSSRGSGAKVYLQTLQVRLRHGALAVSVFTALLEIASRLAACETLRDGPSAPPDDEKFPPSQIPDFWETCNEKATPSCCTVAVQATLDSDFRFT